MPSFGLSLISCKCMYLLIPIKIDKVQGQNPL